MYLKHNKGNIWNPFCICAWYLSSKVSAIKFLYNAAICLGFLFNNDDISTEDMRVMIVAFLAIDPEFYTEKALQLI